MAQEQGDGTVKFDAIGSLTSPMVISGFWVNAKAAAKTVTVKDNGGKVIFKFLSTADQTNGGVGGLRLKTKKIVVSTITSAAEVVVYFG